MIRCVIFDIDNTLYDYTKANKAAMEAVHGYAEKELGLIPDEFDRLAAEASRKITGRLSKDNPGGSAVTHNRLIRFQNLLETCNLPPYPHALNLYNCYWNTLLDNMECAPYCREVLQELQNRKIRTGIGTDMTAYMQYRKLERLDLLPLIQFIVTSEEAGVEKPDSKFFELCIQKAQCAPEECLFIGDNPKKDIEGAQKAGMKTLRYCPGETSDREGFYRNLMENIHVMGNKANYDWLMQSKEQLEKGKLSLNALSEEACRYHYNDK